MSLHTAQAAVQPTPPQPLPQDANAQQGQQNQDAPTAPAPAPAMVQMPAQAPLNPPDSPALGLAREDDSSDSDSNELPHSPPDVVIRHSNNSSAKQNSVSTELITMIAREGNLQYLHDMLQFADTPLPYVQQPLIYWIVRQVAGSEADDSTHALGIDIVSKLIDLGASVTLSEEDYSDAMDIALESHNEALFSILLEGGIQQGSVTATDKSRLLTKACKNNNVALTNILLMQGADPNNGDLFGRTPLHIACEKGDVNLVSTLIGAGARPDAIERLSGNTPLMVACVHRNDTVIQWLAVNCPVGVIQQTNLEDKPPLYFAAMYGNPTSFQALLDAQVGLHQLELDKTVLKGFAVNKHKIPEWQRRLSLFLQHLPDIDAADADGRTLLFYAARTGDVELVSALIDFGANPLHVDNSGRTANDYGVMFTDSNAVFFFLEEVKAAHRARIPRNSNSSAD